MNKLQQWSVFMVLHNYRAVAVGCLLVAGSCGGILARDPTSRLPGAAVRVLILSGSGNHDWRATTPVLRRILEGTGRFDVRVAEFSSPLTARALLDFDVVVDDCGGTGPGTENAKVVAAFVAAGRGLVITHGALDSSSAAHGASPVGQLSRPDASRTDRGCWPRLRADNVHGAAYFLEVKLARPEHPIVRGMPGRFRTADAPYRGLVPTAQSEIMVAPGDGSSADEPVLVASDYGKGRFFCTGLGHDVAAMQAKEFICTFARGTEWAGTGTVTLPVDAGQSRPETDAVKALLITGGHDHDASFYTLFEPFRDLHRLPVVNSATAFKNDLRGKYDVLIMYDFSRELDESGKKNLRDFVEAGKGIVVLHHALLNYQGWPWWFEEVVGGRYRLKREANIPSSTVKEGQQIFVAPEQKHPITEGIGRFQVMDETYKGMWISNKIRPLLTTDNPNSDRYLAWIGPCATSRVVAIQLGHGPTVFSHPSYRTLVHNAILWSAGRLK
jgi:type 1 glutamine amidotransferase